MITTWWILMTADPDISSSATIKMTFGFFSEMCWIFMKCFNFLTEC